jgi:hypothetical protein
VLKVAPTPTLGAGLSRSKVAAALRRGGRQRRIHERASEIQTALRSPQLQASAVVATAMGSSVSASVAVIATMVVQINELAGELESGFDQHPDAEVVRSLPGLGTILGAWVLGEFGDDPDRYATTKCRKNYAGTSPITRASGTKRVVLARFARNQRPSTFGPSPLSPPHQEPGRSTTPTETQATLTMLPSEPSGTAWSVFSTVASSTTAPMTKPLPGDTVPRTISPKRLDCCGRGMSKREEPRSALPTHLWQPQPPPLGHPALNPHCALRARYIEFAM